MPALKEIYVIRIETTAATIKWLLSLLRYHGVKVIDHKKESKEGT